MVVDWLLIEKAKVALRNVSSGADCAVSPPLEAPYAFLLIAVFRGASGDHLAGLARGKRSFELDGRMYRLVADVSGELGKHTFIVES